MRRGHLGGWVALGVAVILVGLVGWAAAAGNPLALSTYVPPSATPTATDTLLPPTALPPDANDAGGWLGYVIVGVLGLAALVAIIGVVVAAIRLFFGRRVGIVHRRVLEPEEVARLASPFGEIDLAGRPEPVAAAVESGLAQVVTGSDIRAAILEAWIRLEEAAASVGTPREDPDAPADLVERLEAIHQIRGDRLERLADLYRLARFSESPLTEAHRRAAAQALAGALEDITGEPVTAQSGRDASGHWPARWS